ncbi:MAG TPA: alkyl sulfatase dimerization domain-containing protein [Solirubrobacteraceae bacterium]|jgi:alkyl sulfatase BDS1-like metallo-beta-lactamase superfamily hydrolase|nr:alkyl sulfatase dimerization domain-containing protein [Solirubrobacteraceae bacterium]
MPERAPTEQTREANRAVLMQLPFTDREDFEDARRGLIAPLSPTVVENTEGRVVWDADSYAFLEEECPETVNPSLWRQSQLSAIHGLFEVTPGIYQVRGADLSNMTLVEGDRGVLVIDPLISEETAAAALALYRAHRGERPVSGLIYTHSHVDHFGGALGVVSREEVARGEVPVLAPEGFLEHAVSENVYAGTAMARRALYQFGALLPRGPEGQVGCGLGMTVSTGSVGILPPTREITRTGQEEEIDGIKILFQLTPDTEAPAEMNFLFPARRALCIAENATHNLHNLLAPRGAPVRDARMWSRYLTEAIALFGAEVEVMFAGHQWPRWGRARILDFLVKQRDLYGYLHDQTLRLINKGFLAAEIAETLELPPALAREWHCRGYYGSVNFNVKAIYQRYLGWFDGNPAHLWPHPPEAAAERYVRAIGGPEAVLAEGRRAFAEGDYRWVAELLSHLVFAEPDNEEARELEARALEQLAWATENAPWRNFFLMGAHELREGVLHGGTTPSARLVGHLSNEQLFDAMAIRLDGPRAAEQRIRVNWVFTDQQQSYTLAISNGVLIHSPGEDPHADATLRIERSALNELLSGRTPMPELFQAGRMAVEGDGVKLGELLGLLEEPDPSFPIVTP